MAKRAIAKLFRNGRSQAVRLPQEFRLPGDRVSVRRVGDGVLLQPLEFNFAEWFAELDKFKSEPFMEGGRKQPKPQRRKFFK